LCVANNLVSNDDATGLSSSAKAGIGIGVAIGAVIVITVVAYLAIWRRRSKLRIGVVDRPGTTHSLISNE
jgi:hypothetical protein